MTTASPPTAAPTVAKRHPRWWLRGTVVAIALIIVVPTALYFYAEYDSRVSWNAAVAEADRLDPDWRLTQVMNARRVVPDKENSALQVIAINRKAPNFQVAGDPKYDELFDHFKPNVLLNDAQLELLERQLQKIAGPLEEARLLRNYPYGRFPIKLATLWMATPLPDHQKARNMADWLKHDAWLLAHEGRANEAVESCRACLCTGRTYGDEPFVLSHLIRTAIQTQAIIALERVLAQSEPDDAALHEMQKLLALEIKESTWVHSLRGERAGTHMLFEDLKAGNLPLVSLKDLAPTGHNLTDQLHHYFPATIMRQYPEHLQEMTRLIEFAKVPTHEARDKIKALDSRMMESHNAVIKSLMPSIGKIYHAECRSQANLRAAMVAVACERYRLANKKWPESLDALVQAKLLDAVPVDSIDGKALRFRRDKDMIVIYSIGGDEVDNGGLIDRERGDQTAIDFGFRLWNADKRRLPRP